MLLQAVLEQVKAAQGQVVSLVGQLGWANRDSSTSFASALSGIVSHMWKDIAWRMGL
jgi:hypothetical protein